MIRVCVADNQPVVHYGMMSYFKNPLEINIVAQVGNFDMVEAVLNDRPIDVLVIDLDLMGLDGSSQLVQLMQQHKSTKIIIFTALNESVYAPNAIKAGVSGYVPKHEKLDNLGRVIVRVYKGSIVYSDEVRSNLSLIMNLSKKHKLVKRTSNRETEVLKLLSQGKKNKEISKILDLNEKTISTYKLRLLKKFQVNNLIDLVEKAKKLDIF